MSGPSRIGRRAWLAGLGLLAAFALVSWVVASADASAAPWLVLVLGALPSAFVAFRLRSLDDKVAERSEGQAQAQHLARLGSWSWDPRDDSGEWSAEMFRIFGRDPELGSATRDEFVAYLVAEDRPRLAAAYAEMLSGGISVELDYRIRAGTGAELALHALASPDSHHPGRYVGTVQDVTALRAIERELLATQQELVSRRARLQAIIDHAPAAMVLRDLDGRYEHVNQPVADALGMSCEELIGRSSSDHHGPEMLAKIAEQDARLIAGREPLTEELEMPHADGTRHTYHVVKYPVTDADGAVTGLGSFSLDITALKRIEAELRDRERELTEAHTLAQLGTWEWDMSEPTGRWSDQVCETFGRPNGFAPTFAQFMELIHPDDRAFIEERVAARGPDAESVTECRIVRPDGAVRHIALRRFGRPGPDGEVTVIFGTVQDITDRRHAELEAQRARDHAEAIITAMGEGYALSVDGHLAAVNDALCELTGFSREQLTGAGMPFPFWPNDRLSESFAIRDQTVAEGGGTFEITLMRADGSRFEAEITAQPAHNPDGSHLGFVNTIRDISARKRYEAELERERRDLNEAQAVARVGSWDYDLVTGQDGRWSDQMWRMLKLEPQESAPSLEEAMAMVHPDDRNRVEAALAQLRVSGEPWDGEIAMIAADGRELRVAFRAELSHDEHGRPTTVYGTMQDVTARAKRAAEERALRRIAELVAANAGSASVFSAVAVEVQQLFAAHSGMVLRFDETAGTGTIISGQRWDGEPMEQIDFALDTPSASTEVWRTGKPARFDHRASSGNDPAAQLTARDHITSGVAAPVFVSGKLWGTLGAAFAGESIPTDAEQRLERFGRLMAMAIANAEAWDGLSRQASTDGVTGLANHRTFQDRLRAEVTRARRYHRDLSLVLLDIDHFKAVNDTYGHQAGDKVLAEIGRRLNREARQGELVARIGGEEFAWLMPETDRDGAYQAAERLRRVIESEPFLGVGTLTVCAGVCANRDGLSGDDLVRFADRALYWAKDGGRNMTFLYTDDAHTLLVQRSRGAKRH